MENEVIETMDGFLRDNEFATELRVAELCLRSCAGRKPFALQDHLVEQSIDATTREMETLRLGRASKTRRPKQRKLRTHPSQSPGREAESNPPTKRTGQGRFQSNFILISLPERVLLEENVPPGGRPTLPAD